MISPYIQRIRSRVGSRCLIIPGVRAVIINEKKEVLLQYRTDVERWGLPAGTIEMDETAFEALTREVYEETSLKIRQAEPMALYSGPEQWFRYPNGDEIQAFSIAFIIRQWSGRPKADGEEGTEVRFWPIEKPPGNILPNHAKTLTDYQHYSGQFMLLP